MATVKTNRLSSKYCLMALFGTLWLLTQSAIAQTPDWPAGVMVDLGAGRGIVTAMSADGSVIVGSINNAMFPCVNRSQLSAESAAGIDWLNDGRVEERAVYWGKGAAKPTVLGMPDEVISGATAVSADGSVIVGWACNAEGNRHAVYWKNGVFYRLDDRGVFPDNVNSVARAVSADGSVIVGQVGKDDENHAVYWKNGTLHRLEDRKVLPGNASSNASAVSADGSVIAGQIDGHATYWKNGMDKPAVAPEVPGEAYSAASAVSANGAVIVGRLQKQDVIEDSAFYWKNGSVEPTILKPGIAAPGADSLDGSVSADGSVIVWGAQVDGKHEKETAVYWENGSAKALKNLGGSSEIANAVSADGSVIVGSAYNAKGKRHAVYWGKGVARPVDLGTLLGGTDSNATSVSANGSVVIGISGAADGYDHTFVYKIPMRTERKNK